MKNKTVLLTGATGSFGKLLLKKLIEQNAKVITLVRAENNTKAKQRIKDLLELNLLDNQIDIIASDLTKTNLGLSKDKYQQTLKTVTHVLHSAASTRFNLSIKEARTRNVLTTKNIVNFANSCKQLERFGYVSTAFVAGKHSGRQYESFNKNTKGFINTYQQSKYEAEEIVYLSSLPKIIYRPTIIKTDSFKLGDRPLSAFNLGIKYVTKGLLPILPGDESYRLDIIDGETAADIIVSILFKEKLKYKTYHIANGDTAYTYKEIINHLESILGKEVSVKFCGDIEKFNVEYLKVSRFRPDLKLIINKTKTFLPELAYCKVYDNSNLVNEMGNELVNNLKPKVLFTSTA